MTPLISLRPADLGLPAKFTEFRPAQAEALEWMTDPARKANIAAGLPTGSGKSLLGIAAAKKLGVRAVYLCVTRGLQDQIEQEFPEAVGVRGRQNYTCEIERNCDLGSKSGCDSPFCPRERALARAAQADLVVTNYACWLALNRYGPGTAFYEPGVSRSLIELVICDEIGEVPELLADSLSVKISSDLEELPLKRPRYLSEDPSGIMPDAGWVVWASGRQKNAQADLARIAKSYKSTADAIRSNERAQYLSELIDKCKEIGRMDSNWVWEVTERGVSFDPVWPGRLTSALWAGVPKRLTMSATNRPYIQGQLGLSAEQYDFREWPAVFPPQYGPVYYHPVGDPAIRFSWKSTIGDYRPVIAEMDNWLDARRDRKTLIQAVSYERMKLIKSLSRHADRFIQNESGGDARGAYEELREEKPGAVLNSPSFVSGWDLPGSACELILIPKIPFPNTKRRVLKERAERDPNYRLAVAIQDIVQMAGRARRYPADRCEVVIFDGAFRQLIGSPNNPFHGYAPRSFRVSQISRIPGAPPKII